jgi:hypothetical protein
MATEAEVERLTRLRQAGFVNVANWDEAFQLQVLSVVRFQPTITTLKYARDQHSLPPHSLLARRSAPASTVVALATTTQSSLRNT